MFQNAIGRDVPRGFEETLESVRRALKEEGFGILTEVDVQATLKAKLGVGLKRYVILGACNPPFAYQALQAEPDVGVMLPCSVAVYERDATTTRVAAIDPRKTLGAAGAARLAELAEQVSARLARAVEKV